MLKLKSSFHYLIFFLWIYSLKSIPSSAQNFSLYTQESLLVGSGQHMGCQGFNSDPKVWVYFLDQTCTCCVQGKHSPYNTITLGPNPPFCFFNLSFC